MLGHGARPGVRRPGARTSTCSTRTTRRRPGSLQTTWGDTCPTPPGAHDEGCAINARLSRLSLAGAETVLLEDFCQQYASHSVGSLEFGPDGMLYLSAGDGASYDRADYGQTRQPVR